MREQVYQGINLMAEKDHLLEKLSISRNQEIG